MNKLICLLLVCFSVNAQVEVEDPNDFVLQCGNKWHESGQKPLPFTIFDSFYLYTAGRGSKEETSYPIIYGMMETYTYSENKEGRLLSPFGIQNYEYFLTRINHDELHFANRNKEWSTYRGNIQKFTEGALDRATEFIIHRSSLKLEKKSGVTQCRLTTKSEFEKIHADY